MKRELYHMMHFGKVLPIFFFCVIMLMSGMVYGGGCPLTNSGKGLSDPDAARLEGVTGFMLPSSKQGLPLTGIYTIGGVNADFYSIQQAFDTLAVQGVSGPVILKVNPGIYLEQIIISFIPGTNDTNRIVLTSLSGVATDVVISHAALSQSNFTLRVGAGNYLEIRDISIRATSLSNGKVIELTGGTGFFSIEGCEIYSHPSARSATQSIGIQTSHNQGSGLRITGNRFYNAYTAIQASGLSTIALVEGVVIENNVIEDYYRTGIDISFALAPVVRGNILRNHPSSLTAAGISLNRANAGLLISQNRVKISGTSTVTGMAFTNCDAGSDTTAAMIFNNFISVSGKTANTIGLDIKFSNHQYFYHNSVEVYSVSSLCSVVSMNTGNMNRIFNNVFANFSAGYVASISTSSFTFADYNNLYTNGNTPFLIANAPIASLTLWQSITGNDFHSVSIDPGFDLPGILYPTAPGLNNLGIRIPEVPHDIDGLVRDTLTPDLGAAEFNIASHDAGVISVESPAMVAATGLDSLVIIFRNFGADTLTELSFFYQFNDTVYQGLSWSGSLPPKVSSAPHMLAYINLTSGQEHIKVWTSNPNYQPDPNPWNDTLVKAFLVCNALSGTYTIGPAGSGADFNSFGNALDALGQCGVSGAVDFLVMPGTYQEQLLIQEYPGVSPANIIRFSSLTGNAEDVILSYSASSSTNNYVIRLNGADYITIQNMTLKSGPSGNYGTVVDIIGGAEFNSILGNIIIGIEGASTNSGNCINSGSSIDQYNIIGGNRIRYGYNGILMSGTSATFENGNIIADNEIEDCIQAGIHYSYGKNIIISGNRYQTIGVNITMYGIRVNGCAEGIQIIRNQVYMESSASGSIYGIMVNTCNALPSERIMVTNNAISLSGTATMAYLIFVGASKYVFVANNSLYCQIPGNTHGINLNSLTQTASIWILNNLIANAGGGYAFYFNLPPFTTVIAACDYNNLFTSGVNLADYYGSFTNLAAWQAYTQWDSNSISLNPLYYADNKLYPLNFNLNDLGIPLPEVYDDLYGSFRNLTTPDIGAIEFTPALNDAGISEIIQPPAIMVPGLNSISTRIRNYGMDNLMIAQVHWRVANGQVFSMPWAGSLAPLQETGIIFLGTHLFLEGKHLLEVWTSAPNSMTDGNSFNDTMRLWITVCELISGVYTIGGPSSDFPDIGEAIEALKTCGMAGPVTFSIEPGLYIGKIRLPEIYGTTGTKRLTIQGSTGIPDDVVLEHASAGPSDNYVLRLDGADYVTIKDMTLRNTSSGPYGRVIELMNAASHNIITGNVIESIAGSSSTTSACIYSGNSGDDHNAIINNTLRYGYYGIHMSGISLQSTESGLRVMSNHIEAFSNTAIYLLYQIADTIHGNVISGAANSTTALRLDYCNAGTCITNNRVMMTKSSTSKVGVSATSCNGTLSEPILIANNLILQESGSSGSLVAVSMGNSSLVRFCHNTLISRSGSPNNISFRLQGSCANIDVVNNIMVNEGNGYVLHGGNPGAFGALSNSDHNLFYTASSNMVYAGSPIQSLASWQGLLGHDSSSAFMHPAFLPQYDPVPGNNATNDLGIFLPFVREDILGVARDTLHPDVGAIEFDSLAIELAHLGLDFPSFGCDMGIEPVVILICNQGTDSVYGGLVAGYEVAGGSISYRDSIFSLIPPGDTLYYMFADLLDFSVTTDSLFTIKSWIWLNGDLLQFNDTIVTRVGSLLSPPAPFVSNTSVAHAYPATLQVVNPDPNLLYFWYDQPTSLLAFDTGGMIQTPPLFGSAVFYTDAMYVPVFDTISVGSGSGTSTSLPVSATSSFSWSHSVYRAGEIQSGGFIEAIAYYVTSSVLSLSQSNQRLYLTHTADTVVNAIYPGTAGRTLVYDGPVNWQGPGWNIIRFSQPFMYRGEYNLSVLYENHQSIPQLVPAPYFGVTSMMAGTYYSAFAYSNNWFPGQSGSLSILRPNIQLIGGPNGCRSDRVGDTVYVSPQVVYLSSSPDTTICEGDTVQISAFASGGSPPMVYHWSPANYLSNPFIQMPLANPPVTMMYTVTATDQQGERDIGDVILTVHPLPAVSIVAIPEVKITTPPFLLTNGLPVGGIYSGPGVSNGMFYPALTGAGYFMLTYTYVDSVSGCQNTAHVIQYVDPATFVTSERDQNWTVYPNPARDFVTIRFSAGYYDVVELTNTLGEVIWKGHISSDMEFLEMDTRNHARGLYFLRISGKHGNSTVMIMYQ
ncbi:MAG: right-handed parallel beta-helix repeat-containing protein [Lentimicrobiaceae bacterium]|nr:right-handed parallel beta-helix repeat-containing protein [Lentimicrobiaceae bacterium]